MLWVQRFWLRLQTLFGRNRSAERLDDEIQFHLEHQIAENIAAGMSWEEARHAALRAFGNPTFLKGETRDTWGWIWLEQVGQDLRHGARMLCKNPGFTADRKSTRLNSSHITISYAVFCLKKKKNNTYIQTKY